MNNVPNLSMEDAMTLMKWAVGEKGYLYRYLDENVLCEYNDGEEPLCIVGHVFHYLGISPRDIPAGMVSTTLDLMVERGQLKVTVGAAAVLAAAQGAQDSGATWGQALESARRVYAALKLSGVYNNPFSIKDEALV